MQQLNLEYEPQQPMWPMLQLNPNQLPFVPNYQCEQQAQQFVPYATYLLMAELQSHANTNPPRMYTFNMFARPGVPNNPQTLWQNVDFMMLVAYTIDYAVFSLTRDRREGFNGMEQALQALAPRMVAMQVATNVIEVRPMQGFIGQDIYQEAARNYQFWQSVKTALKQFRMQQQVFGYGPQFGGMQQQTPMGLGFPQGGGVQMGSGLGGTLAGAALGSGAPMQQQAPAQATSYVNQRVSSSSSPYARMLRERGGKQQQQHDPVPDVLQQPFNHRREEPVVMTQTSNPNVAELLEDGSVLIPEATSGKTWKPTDIQPYRPAYRPSSEIRMHRVQSDGTVYVEIHPKLGNMDYDKHNLPNSVFGKPRTGVSYDMAKANDSLARGAAEFSDRMHWATKAQVEGDSEAGREASEKANTPAVSIVVEDEWITDLSEVGLMLATGVKKLERAAALGQSPDVFRMFGFVVEPILSAKDESKLLADLADSRTYYELAQKLEDANENEHDLVVTETVMKRAIVMLNRVLALQLSIPPSELALGTDFDPETIQELEDVLQQTYGTSIFGAYRAQQANNIAAIFQSIDSDEVLQALKNDYINPAKFPEGKAPWIGFATAAYSFTIFNFYAKELDLELDTDTGSLITDRNFPQLYQVIVDLFSRLPGDKTFYRHVFQTIDGVMLDVTEGAVGKEAYMISRAPALWFS